jgi:hypothetical protein
MSSSIAVASILATLKSKSSTNLPPVVKGTRTISELPDILLLVLLDG